jgi:uncharacterized protein YdaU (DUF1376 family)
VAKDKAVFVPFFPSDWITGVAELSCEARGAYIQVLALFWAKEGRVRDDDSWLARQCNLSTRKYRTIKKELIEVGKLTVENGFISNAKAKETLKNVSLSREKASEKASKAAEKRWKKTKETAEPSQSDDATSNATSNANQIQNQSITPIPTNVGLSPKKEKQNASKRGSRLSEDWQPSEELSASIADKENFTAEQVDHEVYQFKNYWLAESGTKACKRSWDAAFRKWCGSSYCDSRQGISGATGRRGGSQGAVQQTDGFEQAAIKRQRMGTRTVDLLT